MESARTMRKSDTLLAATKKVFNSKGGRKWRSHASSKITQAAKANDRKHNRNIEYNRSVLISAARLHERSHQQ